MPHAATNPQELIKRAVSGELDIPEFQRGFVWSPEKVKNLLDSLCRDYPLGAILCWRASTYESARTVSSAGTQRLWVVDGQQRTTALCLLVGKRPYWFPAPESWNRHFAACNIMLDLNSDPDELELSLLNPVIAKQPHWVPVRELLSLSDTEVAAKTIEMLGRIGKTATDTKELQRVMSLLNVLRSAMQREIVVIEIGHDPVDVAEIFARLNSAGTRVNEGDIALALIAVRQEGWVREELLPYIEDLTERGYEFDPSFVIRSMVAIRKGVARFRDLPRDFWDATQEFKDGWERTKKAINNVVRVLKEVGVLTTQILPARNALIPLFALDDMYFKGDAKQLRRSFYWLLRALRDGRYSSAATTTIAQDLTAMRNAGNPDDAIKKMSESLAAPLTFRPEDMLSRYDENDFLRLMLYLIAFENGAEDWKTGQRLGFDRSDNTLNDGFRPEWHHFVPRGRLRKRKPTPPTEEAVNSLANIVVLGEGDNRRFSYSEPHTYLKKYGVPDARVQQQFFPDRAMWTPDRFEEFVQERSKLLAAAMNDYVTRMEQGKLKV